MTTGVSIVFTLLGMKLMFEIIHCIYAVSLIVLYCQTALGQRWLMSTTNHTTICSGNSSFTNSSFSQCGATCSQSQRCAAFGILSHGQCVNTLVDEESAVKDSFFKVAQVSDDLAHGMLLM